MKRRSNLLLYLFLNILVSAATTLTVLWIWDNARPGTALKSGNQPGSQVLAENTNQVGNPSRQPETVQSTFTPTGTPAIPFDANSKATMPPTGQTIIQINSVVGAGDMEQEVVILKRAGEGNLRMVGWKLVGEHNNTYTFPEQPELILYKDGAVQVFTKTGTDTVTEVYWNRTEAAWQAGEMIRLVDPEGNERASYRVP